MASRFNIKERMEALNITSKLVIDKLNKDGIDCSPSDFSKAINGNAWSARAELIAITADSVVSKLETALA